MSLTVTEQLSILKGNDPDLKPPSNVLLDLVHQIAVVKSKWLYDNPLNTEDPNYNSEVQSYYNKMIGLSDRVFNSDSSLLQSLKRLLITIYGEVGNIAQVTQASDSAWENNLTNNMFRAMELASGVVKSEKDSYEAYLAG